MKDYAKQAFLTQAERDAELERERIRGAEAAKWEIITSLNLIDREMGRAFSAEFVKELVARYYVDIPQRPLPF